MFNTDQLHTTSSRTSASFLLSSLELTSEKKRDEVQEYLWQNVNILSPGTRVFKSKSPEYLNKMEGCKSLIHLHKLNNLPHINDFLRSVNEKLPVGGTFACCIETLEQREKRIFRDGKRSVYYISDFVINRVLPKLSWTKSLYFTFRKGINRAISLPEILGRLIYCGFRIIDFKKINNLTYFIVEKDREPLKNLTPSYGLLIKMRRIGKDGKLINVYKFRTMYPYSEFIQKLVYDHNSIKPGGKLNNDFRITAWGSVFRKYWLDELPMVINFFKGELKMVGLRPLSQHYFSLYNTQMQNKRFKIKPGLVPPYYYDLPKTLDEIMASEERYIDSYSSKPRLTDMRYFYHAFINIFIKGARSS